jgi:hypothetical protein
MLLELVAVARGWLLARRKIRIPEAALSGRRKVPGRNVAGRTDLAVDGLGVGHADATGAQSLTERPDGRGEDIG